MFEQTFVATAPKSKEPVTFAFSVLLEICALGVIILMPLIYTQSLPTAQLRTLLMAPAAPTTSVKAPAAIKPQLPHAITRRFSALMAPIVIPKQINVNVQDLQTIPAPDISIPGMANGGTAGTGSLIPNLMGSAPAPPPANSAAIKPKVPAGPIKISTGIAEANLIRKVMPVYPPLAKSARVQGTVEFTAVISKEGIIENLQVVRGHPLLIQAAKEAVLQWRYRPTLLNGQPVEVLTDIFVNFTLSQ